VGTLTCDLTAFGGKVVSATGPAENLTVSSGTAKVPQGKEITCQVDLTGVVGRNRVKAALTTGKQTFSSDYVNIRPVIEVETHPTDLLVEAEPTGTYEVEVGYSVTFTNNTDAVGQTSNVVLHPPVPAGFALKYVWGSGTRWWISMDDYALQDDGSIPLSTSDTLYAHSSTTMTFTSTYQVNAEAVTAETWKSLGTCDPKDPSKGLTTQIDVVGSDGVEPGTHPARTRKNRAGRKERQERIRNLLKRNITANQVVFMGAVRLALRVGVVLVQLHLRQILRVIAQLHQRLVRQRVTGSVIEHRVGGGQNLRRGILRMRMIHIQARTIGQNRVHGHAVPVQTLRETTAAAHARARKRATAGGG